MTHSSLTIPAFITFGSSFHASLIHPSHFYTPRFHFKFSLFCFTRPVLLKSHPFFFLFPWQSEGENVESQNKSQLIRFLINFPVLSQQLGVFHSLQSSHFSAQNSKSHKGQEKENKSKENQAQPSFQTQLIGFREAAKCLLPLNPIITPKSVWPHELFPNDPAEFLKSPRNWAALPKYQIFHSDI